MKGIILAGGKGSRLRPLTYVTNKHLLPVYDRPMIYWSIETMRDAGLTELLLISGREHAGDFLNLLGSGKQLGVKITYEMQEDAGGIAQALGLAEDYANGEPVAVLLGDNFLEKDVKGPVQEFAQNPKGAKIFLTEVEHPEWYGVCEMKEGKVCRIVEKPKREEAPSSLAVIGLYLYDNAVFDIVKKLKPSARGELEITDVNNAYIERQAMEHAIIDGWWADAGESHEMYLRAQNLAAIKANNQKRARNATPPQLMQQLRQFESAVQQTE